MHCYACDRKAPYRCPRCGNAYCGDHGQEPSLAALPGQTEQSLCADCLNPVNAAPTGAVFRASLLAMLLGSVLALWLLIRPPGLPGESSGVVIPEASPLPATPTPVASPTAGTPTPTPEVTPEATPTPTPEPTAEPTPTTLEYTVVEGDTWYGIAEAFGVDAEALAAYNGYTLDDLLQPGQVLTIPQ